jgi:hypothetical protein
MDNNDKFIDLLPCIFCGARPTFIHHLKTRGSGGGDEWWNVINICMIHHREIHDKGFIHFWNSNHEFQTVMRARGWEVDGIKYRNYRNRNRGKKVKTYD